MPEVHSLGRTLRWGWLDNQNSMLQLQQKKGWAAFHMHQWIDSKSPSTMLLHQTMVCSCDWNHGLPIAKTLITVTRFQIRPTEPSLRRNVEKNLGILNETLCVRKWKIRIAFFITIHTQNICKGTLLWANLPTPQVNAWRDSGENCRQQSRKAEASWLVHHYFEERSNEG